MVKCERCRTDNPDTNRFCGFCAARLTSSSPASQNATEAPTAAGGASSNPSEEGRFLPGTLLGDRYRIISLLGAGGMGEVYRATDLRLGQQVALKFLTEETARDPRFLARFHNEVKIARQVSHPNVCRVYDIGEVEGMTYISMEYVDGEDLHSLLRRIGRLPSDKALEIARKLCAGLAAAHDKGVLHRDLKPSNIMIDGRGHVLITDFGLAGVMGQIEGAEVRNGTPGYMAPEQLSGKEVSAQSDIFALGVVLYEMFTGRQPYIAATRIELLKLTEKGAPPNPRQIVRDIDPGVESAILRCLAPDPSNRPASAFAVLAALPGGDPLAAALAAGETPSPEMVAASGQKLGMKPAAAIGALAATLAGLLVYAITNHNVNVVSKIPMEKPPEALAEKARETAQMLGYTTRPAASAQGFEYRMGNIMYMLRRTGETWALLAQGRPPALLFWYRSSPGPLVPWVISEIPHVTRTDPPETTPGMLEMTLDLKGRLLGFTAMPALTDGNGPKAVWPAPDWKPLFAAAGLDQATFTPVEAEWTPPVMADARAAWTGVYPESPKIHVRVEAAAFHGKPVYFQQVVPGLESALIQQGRSPAELIYLILQLIVIVGAIPFARYNLHLGRGDTRGATRLALFALMTGFSTWLIGGAHVAGVGEADLFFMATMSALFGAVILAVTYLSFEPFVRRKWPQTIVAWSRILAGAIRDPLVGRDVTAGTAIGVLLALIQVVGVLTYYALGIPAVRTTSVVRTLSSGRYAVGEFMFLVTDALFRSLGILFLIFLCRTFVRKQWLAATIVIVALASIFAAGASHPLIEWPVNLFFFGVMIFTLMRFGLLALSVAMFVVLVLISFPVDIDVSTWYFPNVAFAWVAIVVLAIYGFRTALAGQTIFKEE